MTQELDEQRKRAGMNQCLFREVNERIEDLQTPSSFLEFVCECEKKECTEKIGLSLEEYEHIRSDSNRFFVLPGHDEPTLDEVVESNDRYLVVSKLGAGARLAEKLDPRQRATSG